MHGKHKKKKILKTKYIIMELTNIYFAVIFGNKSYCLYFKMPNFHFIPVKHIYAAFKIKTDTILFSRSKQREKTKKIKQ